MYRARIALSLAIALVAIGCQKKPWSPKNYTSSEALYVAAKERLDRGRLDDAIAGFEQLTLDLPARDTLLSRSHFWLGIAHERKREYILAAQSFTRLMESFPDDSLADDALVRAGRAYHRLWRKSYLDPAYGESALTTFNTMLSLYPNSDLRGEAQGAVDRIEAQFAKKDYDTGVHYLKRKAYDPAIIYFTDVVEKYPRTDWARRAQLRLVESYSAINYRAERDEICAALRERFADDGEVRQRCGAAPAAAAQPASTPVTRADSQPASPPPGASPPAPPAPARGEVRLGLLGGTFDPPHVGHLLAAVDAVERLTLDRLAFIPAAAQPLKTGQAGASAEHRLAMVRLLVAGDHRFTVDPIEMERGGLSYSVETLASYAGLFGEAERFFLVGTDVLRTFDQWREPERVLRLATLVVLTRDDEEGQPVGLPHGAVRLPSRRVDVSSTEIRGRVAAGQSLRGFVPDAVADYVATHALYR